MVGNARSFSQHYLVICDDYDFYSIFVGLFVDLPQQFQINSLMPQWYGVILGGTCLVQFLVSLWIDHRYDRGRLFRNYFWVIWYPLFFWLLTLFTSVVAVPKTIFNTKNVLVG